MFESAGDGRNEEAELGEPGGVSPPPLAVEGGWPPWAAMESPPERRKARAARPASSSPRSGSDWEEVAQRVRRDVQTDAYAKRLRGAGGGSRAS